MRRACFAFNHLDELPTQLIAFASIRALNDRLNSAFGETVSENALLVAVLLISYSGLADESKSASIQSF